MSMIVSSPFRSGVMRPGTLARPSEERTVYRTLKPAVDFVLALLLLVLTAPFLGLSILLVKLSSPGPAFYTQTRLGRWGRPFTIIKMRTMYFQCESLTGACWSRPGDPRITPIGRFLRVSHLDELPQLWNILRGDMSLIGPRPERPEFVPQLEQAIPLYRQRLLVKPGVSGIAQVQLPPDTDLDGVRIKLAYDLYYLRHHGAWMDLRITLATLFKMTGLSFARIGRLFCFPPRERIEDEYERRVGSVALERTA